MADAEEPSAVEPVTAWGTWEELLLASAVGRHGCHDWDSVALELQACSSLPNFITTARHCELKFRELKHRFSSVRKDGVVSERENGTDLGDDIDGSLWVVELRKLRVAELRRQVQRSDFSIHSLQLKVKRLEEERDRSLKEQEISLRKADLEENSGEQRSENDKEFSQKSVRSEPERTTLKVLVSGEESDGLYHSVDESNSTGSVSGGAITGEENTQSENKPGLFCSDISERLQLDSKPATADSDNASSDTVDKDPAREPLEPSQEKKVHESSELDDSLARSNGEEEETRESSEVHSSASLAGKRNRKKRQRREITGGTIGEQAPLHATVLSEQLNEILGIIQAHHRSPSFESRLLSQEIDSQEYKNIVRRHIDLETIRGKLHKGCYALFPLAFYRDLLLLFTNAVIFFPKFSDESIAAGELLQLVSTAMKKTQVVPALHPSTSDSSPPIPFASQVPKLERSDSVPIVICRKRSSIAAKPSSLLTDGNTGEEYHNDEEKSSFDPKLPVKSTSTVAEERGSIKENRVREKPITRARTSRRSNDGVSARPIGKKQNASCPKAGSVDKLENPKSNERNSETAPADKRRSAADFLKRMKQNSINSGEKQKKGGVRGEKVKERSTRQSREKKKQAKQNNGASKRSVGRPPKRVAEKKSGSTKRTREVGSVGKESHKRPRKMSER